MKSFLVCAALIALVGLAHADEANKNENMLATSYGGGSSYSAPAAPSYSAPAAPSYSAPAAPSYSAPSYSAPSYSAPAPVKIPAPPCAKNYLFSCSPSLSPVPCSAPQPSSYGSMGSYSHYVPQFASPPYSY